MHSPRRLARFGFLVHACLISVLVTPVLGAAEPSAGLRLPAIFSDNMVLQADMAVPI
jgi:hypothetical protein